MAQAAVPVRGTSQIHMGRLGIAAIVVAVALIAGLAGFIIGGSQPATTSADQALVDAVDAAWSTTYDPAKVAAVYAEDAVFHDVIAGETSPGLQAIQLKVRDYITNYGFRTSSTSVPVRQGDYVITFVKYGGTTGGTSAGISVIQLKDGKVVNHWVYPAD
jgi:ketosteroid isomerase-like protein